MVGLRVLVIFGHFGVPLLASPSSAAFDEPLQPDPEQDHIEKGSSVSTARRRPQSTAGRASSGTRNVGHDGFRVFDLPDRALVAGKGRVLGEFIFRPLARALPVLTVGRAGGGHAVQGTEYTVLNTDYGGWSATY